MRKGFGGDSVAQHRIASAAAAAWEAVYSYQMPNFRPVRYVLQVHSRLIGHNSFILKM